MYRLPYIKGNLAGQLTTGNPYGLKINLRCLNLWSQRVAGGWILPAYPNYD